MLALFFGSIGINIAYSADFDPYDPSIGWQTRHPSLLCSSYFRVNDGVKAVAAKDAKWLSETGCAIVQGGLRLVLLDAPNWKTQEIWRARLYTNDGVSRDVYLRSIDAINFANAGTFKTEQEATIALEEMARRNKREYTGALSSLAALGHRFVSGPAGVRLLIGPAAAADLNLFCHAARTQHETADEMTARMKRELAQMRVGAAAKSIEQKTGPTYLCEEPSTR